jgi:hypothetical protein
MLVLLLLLLLLLLLCAAMGAMRVATRTHHCQHVDAHHGAAHRWWKHVRNHSLPVCEEGALCSSRKTKVNQETVSWQLGDKQSQLADWRQVRPA